MKIGFLSADWSQSLRDEKGHPVPGGCGFYRAVMPAQELANHGIETVISQGFGTTDDGTIVVCDLDGEFHEDCDVMVFQRWTRMEGAEIIKRARSTGQVIVQDVDDWFFGIPTSNLAFQLGHPGESPDDNWDHYRRALAVANALIVSTPYLGQRLERINSNIHVVRNAVDTSMFKAPYFTAPKPVIGWVGSTAHRGGDLETMRGILWPVMERHGLTLFHGGQREGFPSFAEAVGVPPDQHHRIMEMAMRPMYQYPDFFSQFDLGIVPLTMTPFNQAKSAIKGMEYAAAGLPFIAQGTDEYKWFGAGIVCKRPRDWIKAFERLIDPSERDLVAAEAKERVKAEDISVRWEDWANTFNQILVQA